MFFTKLAEEYVSTTRPMKSNTNNSNEVPSNSSILYNILTGEDKLEQAKNKSAYCQSRNEVKVMEKKEENLNKASPKTKIRHVLKWTGNVPSMGPVTLTDDTPTKFCRKTTTSKYSSKKTNRTFRQPSSVPKKSKLKSPLTSEQPLDLSYAKIRPMKRRHTAFHVVPSSCRLSSVIHREPDQFINTPPSTSPLDDNDSQKSDILQRQLNYTLLESLICLLKNQRTIDSPSPCEERVSAFEPVSPPSAWSPPLGNKPISSKPDPLHFGQRAFWPSNQMLLTNGAHI